VSKKRFSLYRVGLPNTGPPAYSITCPAYQEIPFDVGYLETNILEIVVRRTGFSQQFTP